MKNKFCQITALIGVCVLSISTAIASGKKDPEYERLTQGEKTLIGKMYPEKNFNTGAPGWVWSPPQQPSNSKPAPQSGDKK